MLVIFIIIHLRPLQADCKGNIENAHFDDNSIPHYSNIPRIPNVSKLLFSLLYKLKHKHPRWRLIPLSGYKQETILVFEKCNVCLASNFWWQIGCEQRKQNH